MPKPRAPCRIDTITFPVFGSSWWASHEATSDGGNTSIVAYCGGGGASKTGINNKIVIRVNDAHQEEISTEDQVCVAIQVYQNPISKDIYMVGAVGNKVHRYLLTNFPSIEARGELTISQEESKGINAVSSNVMADMLVVGCESGMVALYKMTDEKFGELLWKSTSEQQHQKAVCAVSFCIRGNVLVSSAKDGTAKLWTTQNNKCMSTLTCNVQDNAKQQQKAPPPTKNKRPTPQVLVRGCAFGDLEGKVLYTVASARRGKAYLGIWECIGGKQGQQQYECMDRKECSPCPISAMSLSSDGGLLALGGVDGTITLMNTENWKVQRIFKEVHDLPVTCIAARPFGLPLAGEEDGVQMHAISASADSQLAMLTLQRRVPRKKNGDKGSGGVGFGWLVWMLIWVALIVWILYEIALETMEQCSHELDHFMELNHLQQCFRHNVLMAPNTRPGIAVPPH